MRLAATVSEGERSIEPPKVIEIVISAADYERWFLAAVAGMKAAGVKDGPVRDCWRLLDPDVAVVYEGTHDGLIQAKHWHRYQDSPTDIGAGPVLNRCGLAAAVSRPVDDGEFTLFVEQARDGLSKQVRYTMAGEDISASDVDDIVQSVLVSCWQTWRNRGLPDHPVAYARAAAVRMARGYLKARAALRESGIREAEPAVARSEADFVALSATLEQEIALLPQRQQQVIRLRMLGYGYVEIAKVLGIGEGTVGTHASRALATLRERLRSAEGDAR